MAKSDSNLIWIDLEMTGLDPERDTIIEIATIVTDKELNTLAEGPVLAIHHNDYTLDNMSDWCIKTHGASGLTERVRNSHITMEEAEQQTVEFLEQYIKAGVSPICGNTVGQDRRFLHSYMPTLDRFFHYRSVDVSTIKELARRWNPGILDGVKKTESHLALNDIRESIEELRYYREHFFK